MKEVTLVPFNHEKIDFKRDKYERLLFVGILKEIQSNQERQEIILNHAIMKINEGKGPVLVFFTFIKTMEKFKKKVLEIEVQDRETQIQFLLVWKYRLRYVPKEIAKMISSYITRPINDTELILETQNRFVHTNLKIRTLIISTTMLSNPDSVLGNNFEYVIDIVDNVKTGGSAAIKRNVKMRKDSYKKFGYEIKEL
jgi:hypothetical protein